MSMAKSIRLWYSIHKWTSLVCTAFLLTLCLTGLPLIFSDEISTWLDDDPPYAVLPANAPLADLDHLVDVAKQKYPEQIITSAFMDDDEPQVIIGLAPSWKESEDTPDSNHWIKFDSRTGQILEESKPAAERSMNFLTLMMRLHIDLFARLPGQLFLGLMGILFVLAAVSGVALYGPFMKKLEFGTVRKGRSSRLKWLDLHNLFGIVTLVWVLVVGFTGALNEFSTPLFALWQRTDVQAMLLPWQGAPPPNPKEFSSLQEAVITAKRAVPAMTVLSVSYPGGRFGSAYHYLIWAKGNTPLTSRLFSPLLVDARTGSLTSIIKMPWYLRALEVSRPLHFGDYGGLPLKIIWTLLDLITLVVLGSGLYLWVARRKAQDERVNRLIQRLNATSPIPIDGIRETA
ncbi:PepSY-associated TM helix domain-containing protein [Pollutimonas bauzanensis]|uniref:Uncharacterized iron-regulated membrane protein n=1 Tax=Pollutimonas bauzanensis TaxID=658167 RepID=A0A1M5W1Z5_9BURK|nr:PepSY-associated TM helix domain-containing protein [Pollutimonas bauzanensis]SHH81223.1 Uncharacterized iron-regulated membrane protein [Pollutimonas bauzanensis]